LEKTRTAEEVRKQEVKYDSTNSMNDINVIVRWIVSQVNYHSPWRVGCLLHPLEREGAKNIPSRLPPPK
jgi:hypothetical protein